MTTRTVSSTDNSRSASVNEILRESSTDSTIIGISLYSGRAEISRRFKFKIMAGENKVIISGLPRSFQEDSLRVDGQGNASIRDVVVSRAPSLHTQTQDTSSTRKLGELMKALESALESREMLKAYLTTVNVGEVGITKLDTILDGYAALTKKADQRILDLEDEISKLEVKSQGKRASETPRTSRTWQATIILKGQVEEVVVLILNYVVYGADWTPSYDIRVDTQAKKENVTILYTASITQNTGETWQHAPLTLETATPLFGVPPPVLAPWTLSAFSPRRRGYPSYDYGEPIVVVHAAESRRRSPSPSRRYSRSRSPRSRRSLSPEHNDIAMVNPGVQVSSNKGSIAATFRIPGRVDILSDGSKHNVTISQFKLEAKMVWYSAPKLDTRTHLKAMIRNTSEYVFVPGSANVFLDGSFVASNQTPSVSPQESFDCPLGSLQDRRRRQNYLPSTREEGIPGSILPEELDKVLHSTHDHCQRQIHQYTRSEDRPVSQDDRIQVQMRSPKLTEHVGTRNVIEVGDGVKSQWDGADDEKVEEATLGKDGKLNWLVTLLPHKTVNLSLKFDVAAQDGLAVEGL